jgi:hypothetical protein
MKSLQIASIAAGSLVVLACSKGSGADLPAQAASLGSTAAAPATAAGGSATKTVDLAPLPLTIKMPGSEAAMTMDKTMDNHKSVGVSYDAISAGLNISEAQEKSFDAIKKQWKGDTVMFPFKRWVSETPTTAVEEFSESGKTGYVALSWKVVGGKSYLCQSAGLSGLKSPDDAAKIFAVCDSLTAK